MDRSWKTMTRRLVSILSAGLLLQANGCSLDATTLQGLFTTISERLVADFVFGAFNLPTQAVSFGF